MLSERRHNGLIKIITGARRVGKSYLLNELFYRELLADGVKETQIIRFAFDVDEDVDLLDRFFPEEETRLRQRGGSFTVNAKKFRAFIAEKVCKDKTTYLLLDEIQLLDHFTGTLNGFLRQKNLDVYVTGSNSRFLSSDIATEFRGRGSVIHVFPLVFSEYMQGNGQNHAGAWREYIETGGIPLVALMKTREERRSYLRMLCEEIYLKDVISRNSIHKTEELEETFDIVASMIGGQINALRIANTFRTVKKKNITDDTISKYLAYFEEAFLVSKARRYSIRGRKLIGSPYKLYFEDVGIRNARLHFRQIEESHLMENIIYNELRYRGFTVNAGEMTVGEKTGRRDKNGAEIYEQKSLEVDFVAEAGSGKYYIQSALSMESAEKALQEKRSLYHINDSFRKIVVTRNDLHMTRDEKGVMVVDLFEFLENDSLLQES